MKKKQYPDYGAFMEAISSSYDSQMIGRLVRSKAGRDKGRYYLVLARAADILYLADGRMLMEGPTEYVFEGYFDIPIASFYNGTR